VIGAVDIGGTKIAAGIVDPEGRVLSRAQVSTNAEAA
jgi:predicted NBD/HSP70 family sugar kinase